MYATNIIAGKVTLSSNHHSNFKVDLKPSYLLTYEYILFESECAQSKLLCRNFWHHRTRHDHLNAGLRNIDFLCHLPAEQ